MRGYSRELEILDGFLCRRRRVRGVRGMRGHALSLRSAPKRRTVIAIREERPGDEISIRQLTESAFGAPQEANLIEALREANRVTLSLVAVDGSRIVGHVLFSPVEIHSDDTRIAALGVGLGPMSVLPSRQSDGIGSALVRAGLGRLRDTGHAIVVVLGHPAYYPRFGFRRASEAGVRWEHKAPDEAFMLLELKPEVLGARGGTVKYCAEFDGV
jgi:putative acetyltransferase